MLYLRGGVEYGCLNNSFHFQCLNTKTYFPTALFNPHLFPQYLNNNTKNSNQTGHY